MAARGQFRPHSNSKIKFWLALQFDPKRAFLRIGRAPRLAAHPSSDVYYVLRWEHCGNHSPSENASLKRGQNEAPQSLSLPA